MTMNDTVFRNLRTKLFIGTSEYFGTLLIVFFLGAFLFYPLFYIAKGAFCPETCTVQYFKLLVQYPSLLAALRNSINLAIFSTLLSLLLGTGLALLLTRVKIPFRGFFHGIFFLPLLLPPFVGALALRQMLGRYGTVNLILQKIGVISTPLDWLGELAPVGIVLIQTLHYFPFAYLFLVAALSSLDRALEEAGESVGLTARQVLRHITIPLLLPAIFGAGVISFIGSFTDLGTPLFFEYRDVVPVKLYFSMNDQGQNPLGYALVIVVAIVCVGLFLLSRGATLNRDFSASGRVFRGRKAAVLHPAITAGILLALVSLSCLVLLPHIGIFCLAFGREWFFTPFPTSFTLEHVAKAAQHPLTLHSMKNSLVLSVASTVIDIAFGFLLALLIVRGKKVPRAFLDILTIFPLAVPGIVIAFGYLGAFAGTALDNRVDPFPLLIIAYAVRRLPYFTRNVIAGLEQASVSLEEAGRTVGLSQGKVLFSITFPLVRRYVLSGAILCFAFAMLEVSDSLILALEESSYPMSKALYALTARPDGPPIAAVLALVSMGLIGGALWASEKLVPSKARQ
jgi:iron(III) transport system permease protein